jgi:hypothetical protein
MRKWRKKVSYDCRKKVADSRLRIKGKFVTREQVCSQLGLVDLEQYTGDELKEMLERKMEEAKEKNVE